MPDAMEKAIDRAKPLIAKLSFGGVVGYCSGAAAKKIGKAMAIVAGVAFICIQSASYSGYLSVDWDKVQQDAVSRVDTDADGKLTAKDAKEYWKKVRKLLTHNIPSAGGFSLGFFYGLTTN